jgi:hypothetical protein
MIARNKPAVRAGTGTESPPHGRNRRNLVRVLVSYRALLRGWAFRPNTLADLRPEVTHLDVACSRCDRRGRLSVARLVEQHGAGATIRDAVAGINADCPRREAGVGRAAPVTLVKFSQPKQPTD